MRTLKTRQIFVVKKTILFDDEDKYYDDLKILGLDCHVKRWLGFFEKL